MPAAENWTMTNKPFHDGRSDYSIKRNGQLVGRIFQQYAVGRRTHWFWAINQLYGLHESLQGTELTYDKAKAAFKAAWADLVMRRGIVIVEKALRPKLS